jgi:hypothetical protein
MFASPAGWLEARGREYRAQLFTMCQTTYLEIGTTARDGAPFPMCGSGLAAIIGRTASIQQIETQLASVKQIGF